MTLPLSSTFISLGVGTLYHTWELCLVPVTDGVPAVKAIEASVVDLSVSF